MKFSAYLARKYIFAQKRHSLLTILSITAAVALITAIFTLASCYWISAGNISTYENNYHAKIYDLTQEQAKLLEQKDFVDKVIFSEENITDQFGENKKRTVTDIMFNRKVDDCDLSLQECFSEWGYSKNEVEYHLNNRALFYQVIGFDAKYNLLQMVAVLYIFVLFMIFCSRFIIDTAFEISSKERERQFGILRSAGASKKQIARILLYEGGYFSLIGVPLGLGAGILLAFIIFKAVLTSGIAETVTADPTAGEKLINFYVYPPLLALSALTGIIWALLSAYGTGIRCVKKDPIEVIRSREAEIEKVKKRSLSAKIFGISGKLATRNIRRYKKRFIITIISMSLSISLFVMVDYAVRCFDNMNTPDDGTILAQYDSDMILEIVSDVNTEDLSEYVKPEKIDISEYKNKVQNSGYFSDITLQISKIMITKNGEFLPIYFIDKDHYDDMFDGKPDIDYKDLYKQNGTILLNCTEYDLSEKQEYKQKIAVPDSEEPFKLDGIIYDESYLEKPIEKENDSGESSMVVQTNDEIPYSARVLKVYDNYRESFRKALKTGIPINILIAAEEQYFEFFEKYSDNTFLYMYLDLVDESKYIEAKEFLNSLSENSFCLEKISEKIKEKRTKSAMKIGGYSFAGMVAVIAVINLVNIISTGIINRRREFSSLRSIGMSKKQITKMLTIESLSYALISCFVSFIICTAVMTATFKFNTAIGIIGSEQELMKLGIMNNIKNLSNIIPLTIAAFLIGLIASYVTERFVGKDKLAEYMRMSE